MKKWGALVGALALVLPMGATADASPKPWNDIDTQYGLRPVVTGLDCGLRPGDSVEVGGNYAAALSGTDRRGMATATWWFQSHPSWDYLVVATTPIQIVEVDVRAIDLGQYWSNGVVEFTGAHITERRPGPPRRKLIECAYLGWSPEVNVNDYWVGTVRVNIPGGIPEVPPLPGCWPFCFEGQ